MATTKPISKHQHNFTTVNTIDYHIFTINFETIKVMLSTYTITKSMNSILQLVQLFVFNCIKLSPIKRDQKADFSVTFLWYCHDFVGVELIFACYLNTLSIQLVYLKDSSSVLTCIQKLSFSCLQNNENVLLNMA